MAKTKGRKRRPVDSALEQMTLPQLVDLWAESEIEKRLREVEFFHEEINHGAAELGHLHVLPLLGGVCEGPRTVEVLVEVRDQRQRRSRIGAWIEKKTAGDDQAFQRAYDKAMAHAVIQLLPAAVWRPWIGADAHVAAR